MKGTVLVTGFEAFGAHPNNPTEALVAGLASDPVPDLAVATAVLPVSYERALSMLLDTLASVRPAAVVCCGLDARASAVAVERLAANLKDCGTGDGLADNDGARPRDEPVVAGGPDGLFTTLPNRAILESLHAEGIPAVASLSAGTFVCNTVLYGLLHHLRRQPDPVEAGFLHFPRTPDLAVDDPRAPSMDLRTMRRALEVTVRTVASRGTRASAP